MKKLMQRTPKEIVNKILKLFGYHLVKNPRPYVRKKKEVRL